MKKEKSGLLLVSLVKYLIRAEIETLWSFLRVLSGFQSPHDAIISFPSPAPNSFHTLRERGLEVVLQNTLVSLAKFYIQGFRYLPQMTLMPFQLDLSWSITFPLFLKSDDTVITFLPHLVACLPRSKDWVWKQRKTLWFVTSGVSGHDLLLQTGVWTRQQKVFVYSSHHGLCKPVNKSDQRLKSHIPLFYICIYVYKYVCIYIHTDTCAWINCIYIYVCICAHIHTHIHIRVCMCMYTHTHIYETH